MPRRDGTGPRGQASMNGRGLGFCSGANTVCNNAGSLKCPGGQKRGFGRNVTTDQNRPISQKELLR